MSRDIVVNMTGQIREITVPFNFTFKEENNNMSNTTQRRVVTVQLVDDDKGLPVENSLVLSIEGIVTEDNDETTIREVLMSYDVTGQLSAHNELRTSVVDNEILLRTGNSVMLRPVKLKDLRWIVK